MKIYFDNVLIDEDAYAELTNDYKLFTDNFYLGSTASNTFKITVAKSTVSSHPTEVKITDDTNTYYLIVDKVIDEKNFYIYELVDKLVLFNFEYDASILINARAEDELTTTLTDILTDMCSQAGVTLDSSLVLINDIEVTWYDNRLLARDYLSYIAELQGGFARILDDGKLTIVKQKTTSKATLQIDNCEDFLLGEKKTITRVVYDGGAFKWEFGDDTGDALYLQSDNVFIVNEQIVENIYNNLKDFEFYLLETGKCQLDPSVRAGDVITFTDGANSYSTIAQYSGSYGRGWVGSYSLNVASKQQEETQIIRTSQQVRNIQTKVDRLNNEFSVIAEEIEKLTDYIRNVGTTGGYLMLPDTPKSGGAINTLSIKGFELMPLYPGTAHPSEYTYPGALNFYTLIFDTVPTFDNNPNYVFVNSPIPLQKLGSVYDELLIESNKVKVIQRIGYDFDNEQWSVLSTPITHELEDVLLPTFEGDTYISARYFDNLVYDAEYLIKNDLTSNFATQLESSSQFKLNQDEISSKVNNDEFNSTVTQLADSIEAKVNKDGIVSAINLSPEEIKILAERIKLEGLVTANENFKILLDGSIEANKGIFKGDIYLPDGGRVIGGDGILTNLYFKSYFDQLGVRQDIYSGISLKLGVVDVECIIPTNFTVKNAYLTLRVYKTQNFYILPDGDGTVDNYGKVANIKAYKQTNDIEWINSSDFGSYEDNIQYGTEITNAFGSNGFTNGTTSEATVTSIDIKDFVSTGINKFFVKTSDSLPSQNNAGTTIATQKTQFAELTLTVFGYLK